MEIGHQSQLNYRMPPVSIHHRQLPLRSFLLTTHQVSSEGLAVSPDFHNFSFQEALEIFNANSLAKYLQAVEELKCTVPGVVKLQLEEQSRDACAKWEVRASGPWTCGSGPVPGHLQSHHRPPLSTP